MTVCIAAICDNATILGASDRMMTSGDVEFEPALDNIPHPKYLDEAELLQYTSNSKIFGLTTVIAALTAGDAGLQAEIMGEMYSTVAKRIFEDRERWWEVKEVAELYVEIYNRAKARQLQAKIFEPYGLTVASFLSRQIEMSADFVADIRSKVQRFDFDFKGEHGVETIIVGLDMTGFNSEEGKPFLKPHIYSVSKSLNGDFITCCDSVGFAAIGSGSRHAESQFMLSGHSRYSPMPETLLLVYLAKKRSEIAPGVGAGTDMFVIGPPPAGRFSVLDKIKDLEMAKIQSIYQSLEDGQAQAFEDAKSKVTKHIEQLFKKRAAAQEQQSQSTVSSSGQQQPSSQSEPTGEQKEKQP